MLHAPSDDFGVSREIFRRHARGRYLGRWMFPAWKRPYLDTIFAFLTYIDDVVDDIDAAITSRRLHIDAWVRAFTEVRPDPVLTVEESALWRAMGATMRMWNLTRSSVLNYLQGQCAALTTTEYATDHDLRAYIDTVTLEPARWANTIFEPIDPRAFEKAERVITAFQWIDFLWDIREDLDMGRLYIPVSRMRGMDRSEFEARLRRIPHDRTVLAIIRETAAQVEQDLKAGMDWPEFLHPNSREFMRLDLRVHTRMIHRLLTDDDLLAAQRPGLDFRRGMAVAQACSGIVKARYGTGRRRLSAQTNGAGALSGGVPS